MRVFENQASQSFDPVSRDCCVNEMFEIPDVAVGEYPICYFRSNYQSIKNK